MIYAIVDFRIWVASSFGAELPYCPLLAVFVVEELDERGERVAVGELGVCAAGARGCDDCGQSARGVCTACKRSYCCQSRSRGPNQLQDVWHVDLRRFGVEEMPLHGGFLLVIGS